MIRVHNKSKLKTDRPLVIHVVTSLDYGGVERHMEVIGGVLKYAFMRHMFVAIGKGGVTAKRLRDNGAELVCLEKKTKIPSLGALSALLMLFRQERPVVVHTHGAEANFHGLLAAWITRVPVRIGEEIGMPGHSEVAKLAFRNVYRAAHRVIGVSRVVTEWLINSGEVPFRKALHIDNPVRLPAFINRENNKDGCFRVIFVGRLEPVKNPSCLLAGFAQFLSDDIFSELWIIGSGSEGADLEKQAVELGVKNRVRFYGFQDNPEGFICQCHVFCQPSLSEGFSLGLVEAMACGVPVIASDVGSAREIVENGKTGWLLPQASPDLIASALREACRVGPERLHSMGMCAVESVSGRFLPSDYLRRIESFYQEMLYGRGVGRV